jgi:hypothetical protein
MIDATVNAHPLEGSATPPKKSATASIARKAFAFDLCIDHGLFVGRLADNLGYCATREPTPGVAEDYLMEETADEPTAAVEGLLLQMGSKLEWPS